MRVYFSGLCLAAAICLCAGSPSRADGPRLPERIDFSRDIRPILSDTCFQCHGPDEEYREAELRFDMKESVFAEHQGRAAVVPGNLQRSDLYQRIRGDDPDSRMPPADSNLKLTADQIELFKRWIEQGAKWQGHWSFQPVLRPPVPQVLNNDWTENQIDNFVLARLQHEGLTPNGPADRATLIRRVTLDLTGLPPSPADVEAFVGDTSTDAYEKLVDRLLKSPHYGEHMGRFWLDAARYGDTHGLHLDNYREFWLYRDWVINAFNANKSFKDFTIEQLAGDLLEQPTPEQLIATGFNRAHVTTSEGGSIAEEVYVRNVVDRVSTTSTVFMGLTAGCAVCHDHKYDPITQKEFYNLFAFFNSLDGNPLDGNRKDHAPVLSAPTQAQAIQIAKLQTEIELTKTQIVDALSKYAYVEPDSQTEIVASEPTEFVWIDDAVPTGAKEGGGWSWTDKNHFAVYSGERASNRTAGGLSQHFFTGAKNPLKVGPGDKLFTYVYLDPKNPPKEIMLQWNDGVWEHRAYWGESKIDWGKENSPSRLRIGDLPETGKWVRLEVAAEQVGLKPQALINGWAYTQFDGSVYWDKSGIVSRLNQSGGYKSFAAWQQDQRQTGGQGLPAALSELIKKEPGELNEHQQQQLLNYFVENILVDSRGIFDPFHDVVAAATTRIEAVKKSFPTTLVWKELAVPKDAFILKRGQYDQKGEKVARATPAALPPFPAEKPLNRLGLAYWLVDPQHPLTARVTVNRLWQQLFGIGIVKTSEDFGAQGDWPVHPELLDWLAVEFMETDWDMKRMMKMLVMSSTYRQSSVVTPEKFQRDPENRLLSRGPRFRLDAEMLRDQALAVSGLLETSIGGPSVKPPQPDGLWFAVGYSGSNTVRFAKDVGHEKVHRRSLYTFWKRTAPPPQMNTFDAPSRESCTVRRERTNTPLQALMLMNDPQYVEAARCLAQRAIDEAGPSAEEKAIFMFRNCAARKPAADEIDLMKQVYTSSLAGYQADLDSARKLIAIGEQPAEAKYDAAELASWTLVANLILNLDEVITKN